MSDKSFGDHTNKNIVKNPLLSSAVTGLSLEDLTHKAVLLPVSPSLDQISRSDQQQGTQTRTLAHPHHDSAVFPSGDAISNIPLSNPQPTSNKNQLDSKNNVKLEETRNTQSTSKSKAAVKSDDDFDVNEYIARLQGTRYVSAPLQLKEDKNANLDATEDNLEEINLNEIPETQQSLTADIAQNFSQLPTVLPHVASAVFSSFSNMLYKNREQTPDRTTQTEQKKSGYEDVQFQRPPDVGVPLMGVEEYKPKEVAPPPKEPPTGGASNFRISTKKKYAQIPGLSSGDAAQAMTFMPGQSMPPMGQSMPPMGQSMPPMGQSMIPMGHNMPPMDQNMPPMGQNIPPMGQDMPPMGQNMPPMGQNMPPISYGMPPIRQSMPVTVQGIPPMGQSMPPIGHNMPMSPMSQNAPPMSQNAPPVSQNMLHMRQGVSNVGQSVSVMGQNMPPESQNVMPPNQNMPPTSQHMSPFQPSLASHAQTDLSQNKSFAQNIIIQTKHESRGNTSNIDQKATSVGQNMQFPHTPPSFGQNVLIFDPIKGQESNSAANNETITQATIKAVSQSQYNIFDPAAQNQPESRAEQSSEIQSNVASIQSSSFFTPVENKDHSATPAAIIPPPPMFSNAQRRDRPESAGKSILPPSVAKRISANQPIIKPNTSTPSFTDNIFVPAPVATTTEQHADSSFSSSSSAFVPAYGSSDKTVSKSILPSSSQMNVSSNVQSSIAMPASYFRQSYDNKPANPVLSQTQKTPTPGSLTSNLPPSLPPASLGSISANILNIPPSQPPTSFGPALANMTSIAPPQPTLGPTPANAPPSFPPMPPTSVYTPGSTEPTPQNIPPSMFQPNQNLSYFNPQESSISHPITQMPPTAIEPPKSVPEPPKATGAVNFRMTKKRPQYYAGPIEGVGAISNNVKPVLASVMPAAPEGNNFQGALFTPDESVVPPIAAASKIDQASVPFDISKPVESYAPYNISKPLEQPYGTALSMGLPESRNYEQEYNTPFDTSRDPNDSYNEPKEETKGFGIIGSLKSKLSSIDINKIQNTVTTFFDPAYNDTKAADPVPQNNMPYQQQQYGQSQQGQSNFDIYVPSVEHSQYSQFNEGGYDYSQGSQYYQTQDPYIQNQSQDMSSYSTSSYFTNPNYSTEQVHSSNPLYDNTQNTYPAASAKPQENIPENVKNPSTDNSNTVQTFYNPTAFTQENLAKAEQPTYEMIAQRDPVQSSDAQNYFDPKAQINTTQFSSPAQTEQKNQEDKTTIASSQTSSSNMTYFNPNAYENRQIWEPQQTFDSTGSFTQQSDTNSQKNIAYASKEEQQAPMFYDPNALTANNQHTRAQNPPNTHKNVKDRTQNEAHATANVPEKSSYMQSESEYTCESALNTTKYNLSQPNLASASIEEQQAPTLYDPNAFTGNNQQTQPRKPSDAFENVQTSTQNKADATANVPESTSESTCDSALNTTKYNLSNIHTQSALPKMPPAASFFDNPVSNPTHIFKPHGTDIIPSDPVMKDTSIFEQKESTFEHTQSITPLPIGSRSQRELAKIGDNKDKAEMERKETNLIESISKHEIPIVGVSAVPFFGLATVTDKTKDVHAMEPIDTILKSKSLFEENTASSFFENIRSENKIDKQVKMALSIHDVKNVLMIEPPQENIGALLKRNASSSKLENLTTDKTSAEHFQQFNDSTTVMYPELTTSTFFKHDYVTLDKKDTPLITGVDLDADSELNICETCREVDSPEQEQKHDKPEDLTTQLIENITSKLQLSHPLTVPLPEGNVFNKILQYDQHLDDITQVAEETFETLQVQSATELLDEPVRNPSEIRDYGWVTQEDVEPKAPVVDHDYAGNVDSDLNVINDYGLSPGAVPSMNLNMDHEIDPNNIGFVSNTSLLSDDMSVPNNASDEIKAEMKHSHEDIDFPRQMSVPTAPPEEDLDPKLYEPGILDVHSIEQDAKEDFPLEEEFVIEPTDEIQSTDDDKIEFRERKRSSEDSSGNDTFTHRVEKFKKEIDNDDIEQEQTEQTPYISPPISMASYFDTGNYAVESHFRNSFISMRIPPGFEEEYARKMSRVSLSSDKTPEPYIPDTSTQTRTSNTCTYTGTSDGNENIIGSETKTKENLEAFAKVYVGSKVQDKTESSKDAEDKKLLSMFADTSSKPIEMFSPFSDNNAQETEPAQVISSPITQELQPIPAFADLKSVQPEERFTQNVPAQFVSDSKCVATNSKSLPDPINFFSTKEEETKPIEPAAAEGFSRLASYFSTPPPQPDHSKSFFELSQSQNHYRHACKHENKHNAQKLFETSKNSHIDDDTKNNIKELMKDLTSPQNIQTDIVRTVNYFTVELDQNVNKRMRNSNPINVKITHENLSAKQNVSAKKVEIEDSKLNADKNKENSEKVTPKDDIELVKNCKYCLRHLPGIDNKSYNVKSAVNGNSETKNKDTKMPVNESSDAKKSSVNFASDFDVEKQAEGGVLVLNEHRGESEYTPVKHHWFYRVEVEDKSVWRGFSAVDSNALEEAFHSPDLNESTLVPTDGGRFDVNIVGRLRIAVYWKQKPTNVRRCSWFYKGTTDARYVPYTEAVAEKLEEEYRHGITTGMWHRKLVLPNSEMVIMHGPTVMVHFLHAAAADAFSAPPMLLGKRVYRNPLKIKVSRDQKKKIDHLIFLIHGAGEFKRKLDVEQAASRPRVVRRSHEESEIEESEPSRIDHLLLLCHGVGSACDMRFRSVEDVVEDFRTTSLQLLQSHYRNSYDNGVVSRVEVLPISWHEQLHSGETGVDKRLACVTLDSIPRLRAFTNHTVLDVLFYTSPVFHQTIIDTVCFELNRVYKIFCKRNPNFHGEVSLGGHSLGSVILYDLLCNQMPQTPSEQKPSCKKAYVNETAAMGQMTTKYPQLLFEPAALYALGSPIAIFECIRGVQMLGKEFHLPTCKHLFNIFHPYDPIAYRIEPLIEPQLQDVKPSQIPHHKGRKRMHLELKDTMARVGADLKQKLLDSLRTTWNKWKANSPPAALEKVVEEEMEKEQLCEDKTNDEPAAEEAQVTPQMLGALNCGRRVDYVLQEAPLEMINEYLFAMSSHVGYWESEDTMLLMLREIYTSLGVQPDSTVPQQNMTVQRNNIVNGTGAIHETTDIPSTSRGST